MSQKNKKHFSIFFSLILIGWVIGQYFQNRIVNKIKREGVSTCGLVYEIGKPARSSNSSVYYYFLVQNKRFEGRANGEYGCNLIDQRCLKKKFKIKYLPDDPKINRIYLSEPCE